jgi:hypothetical protein
VARLVPRRSIRKGDPTKRSPRITPGSPSSHSKVNSCPEAFRARRHRTGSHFMGNQRDLKKGGSNMYIFGSQARSEQLSPAAPIPWDPPPLVASGSLFVSGNRSSKTTCPVHVFFEGWHVNLAHHIDPRRDEKHDARCDDPLGPAQFPPSEKGGVLPRRVLTPRYVSHAQPARLWKAGFLQITLLIVWQSIPKVAPRSRISRSAAPSSYP